MHQNATCMFSQCRSLCSVGVYSAVTIDVPISHLMSITAIKQICTSVLIVRVIQKIREWSCEMMAKRVAMLVAGLVVSGSVLAQQPNSDLFRCELSNGKTVQISLQNGVPLYSLGSVLRYWWTLQSEGLTNRSVSAYKSPMIWQHTVEFEVGNRVERVLEGL